MKKPKMIEGHYQALTGTETTQSMVTSILNDSELRHTMASYQLVMYGADVATTPCSCRRTIDTRYPNAIACKKHRSLSVMVRYGRDKEFMQVVSIIYSEGVH